MMEVSRHNDMEWQTVQQQGHIKDRDAYSEFYSLRILVAPSMGWKQQTYTALDLVHEHMRRPSPSPAELHQTEVNTPTINNDITPHERGISNPPGGAPTSVRILNPNTVPCVKFVAAASKAIVVRFPHCPLSSLSIWRAGRFTISLSRMLAAMKVPMGAERKKAPRNVEFDPTTDTLAVRA